MQDTTLTIKQTLATDPEINFINWELNVQDVAATTLAQLLAPKASLAWS
jgi:hypothetical protein